MVRRTIPGCASLFALTLEPNVCACLKRAKDGLIGLFFPPRCVGCDREGAFICAACRQCLPYLVPPLCKSCGRPLITDNCPSCRKWKLEINGIRSPYAFEGIMKQAIYRLKYGQWKVLAAPLGGLLAQYVPTASLPMDVLAPVPLHPRRLRERGYNQSAILAREVGRLLDVPVIEGCLERKSNGRAQARTADAAERRRNVHGAFECRDERLKGRRVVIVDDVCTTGATLDACGAAVLRAGAVSAWGLALAREI